jgi:pyruvate dehydrogenase E1 component alpha subunit
VTVDGNDVLAVYDETKKARRLAVDGKGPVLVEAKTYRWLGHWQADPCRYRDDAEVEEWKKKCPIMRLKKQLIERGILTEKAIGDIDKEIKQEIEETEKFALESPDPDPEEAFDDIYI